MGMPGRALERQARDEAELLLVDLADAVDQLGDVVLQELLALGVEGGDRLLLVGLRGDEAEVELAAVRGCVCGSMPAAVAFSSSGVSGSGSMTFRRDLAARGAHVLAEHLADALGVVLVLDELAARVAWRNRGRGSSAR